MLLTLYKNKVLVEGLTPKAQNIIDRVTRFQPKGFEYWDKVERGESDGIIHLLQHNSFPIGLLDDVLLMLEAYGIPYTLKDIRSFPKYQRVQLSGNLKLRRYQEEAVSAAIEAKRGGIALPTGSGKTIIAIEIIKRLQLPAVFYVNRKELLYQTIRFIKDLFDYNAGQVGDGVVNIKPITVAMLQTATGLPKGLFKSFGVCIIDECHHTPAETIYKVAISMECPYIFGLSATPTREDGKELMITSGIGPIIYNESLTTLIDKGYLARPSINTITTSPITFPKREKYNDVYNRAVIFNEERNKKLVAMAIEASLNGPCYCHVKRLIHGERLCNMINNCLRGEDRKAVFISGEDSSKKRNKILEEFNQKDTNIILVSTLLGEGADLPQMQTLILCTPIKSGIAIRQVFGRLLRISERPGVTFFDVFDRCQFFYDHWVERVKFYRSEEAFIIDDRIKSVII